MKKMPVSRLSIQDLKPFNELKGSVVELNGHKGTITGCCAIDSPLEGKYLKDNRYAAHKRFLNMNNLVMAHWHTGVNQCWQKFDDLKLL